MTPTRIGRYEIQRRLGRGGMGSLYLGYDPKLKRSVAIKLLNEDSRDNQELRERFAREAESVARLRHPNIVVVFDVGEDESGQPFMAMEYIAGETLKRILEPPSIPLPRRLALIEDLCAGLAHAHGAGIVHRDIKPENVMLDSDGVLKILDFGIARHANSGMTQDGMMLGTYNYMSPEQMVGRMVDQRSDIFAVGAVLYEVVALQKAFPGTFPEAYHRILNAGPVPLEERVAGVDPELARIVYRALDPDPARRYQHLGALRQDLTNVRRKLAPTVSDPSERTTAYGSTQLVRPKVERPDTRRQADTKRFAEIRRQQVEEHLRLGQAAFERGDHEGALQHAERAASVEADSKVAFELMDRARLALDTKVVLKLLRDATRLLAEGKLDDASALCDQASAAVPDVAGAEGLREEVRHALNAVRDARERESRIETALRRARDLLEKGGYDTALRAVYEVLALDPDRTEARDLEQRAKERLDAQRERERLTREAYDGLQSALALAREGRYDEALAAIGGVTPPSATVRQAVAAAVAEVESLKRKGLVTAAVSEASAALANGRPELAISRIDAIDSQELTDDARSVRAEAVAQLELQRELARKKHALEEAINAARVFIGDGDLDRALVRIQDAAAIGLEDERLDVLRRQVAELRAAAEAKRREDERRRLQAEQKARADAEQKARADAEQKARAEAERKARAEAEQKARVEAEQRARVEAEQKARSEAVQRARLAAEQKARAEAEQRARVEVEQRAGAEAERKARAAAEQRARLEAEQEARAEAERKARGEAERKARADAEQKAREEAQRAAARLEQERRHEEARRQDEARRHEEAKRREQEEADKQEALTQILTQVRATPAHQEALDLPRDARRQVPDDPDGHTLIQERRAPLVVPPSETRPPVPSVRPVEPGRGPSKVLMTVAAAVVLIGVASGVLYFRGSPAPDVEKRTDTVPFPTPRVESRPEVTVPPSSVDQGTLRVDALPWATVTIRPLSEGTQLAVSEYTTPFSASLPRGEYELQFSNPQYKSPGALRVTVTEKPVDMRVTMQGFDPEQALGAILGAP